VELAPKENRSGVFFDLNEFRGADLQPKLFLKGIKDPKCSYRYKASSHDFLSLPGNPIAYVLPRRVIEVYESSGTLKEHYAPKQGIITGNNGAFLSRLLKKSGVEDVVPAATI
jgi:hypothetical protein